MNTRSLTRLGLIMALFALLLAVSAVAAQDSQPGIPIAPIGEDGPIVVQPDAPRAPKDMAGIEAPYETAALTANKTESEANNTFATADVMAIGDVMSGKIKGKGDVDYFRINVPAGRAYSVLIDIDAQVDGSDLDPVVCLYDKNKSELFCNDDAEGYDSLIFSLLWSQAATPGSPYYITVRDYNHPNEGGDTYTYKLAVYRPLLVSAAVNGAVAGIAFDKADILAHYDFPGGVERWKMFFDASDVGITTNVVGLSATDHGDDNDISLVLQNTQSLSMGGTAQTVTPYDVILFSADRYGPNTSGSVNWFMYRGGDYGLTAAGEKIDALARDWWVSTLDAATYNSGLAAADEDISNLPYGVLYFDGSRVPGLGAKDVSSADVGWDGTDLSYYMTIDGSGTIDGKAVTQKDIFKVNGTTYRVTGIQWKGKLHHFPYNIDAFDIVE